MILPTTATLAGLALAWLVTYLVHSTVTLGLAWGASRLARRREREGSGALSLGIEETIWKLALVGALATATLQVGWLALGAGGLDAAAAVPGVETAPIAATSTTSPMSVETPAEAAGSQAASAIPTSPAAGAARTSLGAVPAGSSSYPSHPMLESVAATLPGWQRLLLSAWLAGGLLGLGLLAFTWTRLRRRLAGRELMAEGDARQALDRLMERSREAGSAPGEVRLTRSGELPVPVALGVGEREICVPRDVLDELPPREREGLLAHELAHLLRRDPLWLLTARTMEAVFFLQPLNRVARRRLQEIAELSADAWAVSQTGDRLGLARCLERVAGSLVHRRSLTALPVPGMASREVGLAERVRRILSSDDDAPSRPARWVLGAAAGVLALTLLVPGLAPPRLEASMQEEGPIGEVQERAERGEREVDRARRLEREAERRMEEERARAEHEGHQHDGHHDHGDDHDFDHDFDFDFDFTELADIGPEIEAAMAEVMESLAEVRVESLAVAMEARQQALVEVERALAQAEAFDDLDLTPAEREEMRRELAQAREELAREMAMSDREMAELHRELSEMQHEIRRELDRAMADMPSREELARIAEEARREAMEAMPSQEELRQLREEARREAEEHRHHLRDERREKERHREQMHQQRDEMRQQRDQMRQQMREQMERQEVERRRQLERAERQIQREIERLEADGSPEAREAIGDLRDSLGDLREERVELEAERHELERELEQEMAEMERDLEREMAELDRELAEMDQEVERAN